MGRDEIVTAATGLFSALGYDGTSAELIARTAGVPVRDVETMGGKRGVYEAVMKRFLDDQLELMSDLAQTSSPGLAGLHQMMDQGLDFCIEHPELVFLWQQRGLSDASDITSVEATYSAPLIHSLNEKFLQHIGIGPDDLVTLLNVVSWSFRGFLTNGMLLLDGTVLEWRDPRAQRRFRADLHRLVDLLSRPAAV